MAERRPLVIIDGVMQELPAGDTLPGAGGGGWDPFATISYETASFTIVPGTLHICNGEPIVATLPTGAPGEWAWLAQSGWGAEIQLSCPSGVSLAGQAGPWTRNVAPAGSAWPYGTTSIIVYCVDVGEWMSLAGHLQ